MKNGLKKVRKELKEVKKWEGKWREKKEGIEKNIKELEKRVKEVEKRKKDEKKNAERHR